jgi:hypothetical protein
VLSTSSLLVGVGVWLEKQEPFVVLEAGLVGLLLALLLLLQEIVMPYQLGLEGLIYLLEL